jgi:hypothetical protein
VKFKLTHSPKLKKIPFRGLSLPVTATGRKPPVRKSAVAESLTPSLMREHWNSAFRMAIPHKMVSTSLFARSSVEI